MHIALEVKGEARLLIYQSVERSLGIELPPPIGGAAPGKADDGDAVEFFALFRVQHHVQFGRDHLAIAVAKAFKAPDARFYVFFQGAPLSR